MGLILLAGLLAGWVCFWENPQHNPWAPLDLRDPIGWATDQTLLAMRGDTDHCRAVLSQSKIRFEALPQAEEGACVRPDRTRLPDYPFAGSTPSTTCPVAVALHLWLDKSVQPAAREIFGQDVATMTHLGSYNCRRLYGREEGPWSEHATGNAIDIAGFVLTDGTSITVLNDWEGDEDSGVFLKQIRDGACSIFGTVLSPDYNAAHRDHFHFDQANRNWGVCR